MRHHTARHGTGFRAVTIRAAAGLPRDAQVAGIDEPHEFKALALEQRTRTFGNSKLSIPHPFRRKSRPHMCGFFFRGGGIAAMASRTSQPERVLPVIELIECRRRAEPVHRFDLVVTLKTAFSSFGRIIYVIGIVYMRATSRRLK